MERLQRHEDLATGLREQIVQLEEDRISSMGQQAQLIAELRLENESIREELQRMTTLNHNTEQDLQEANKSVHLIQTASTQKEQAHLATIRQLHGENQDDDFFKNK